ncbi:MAG: hypothetical protein M3X11_25155 [Acidobacteriota bacterium]|nr:hypothetical protein [Acidobacteriota bacterium]
MELAIQKIAAISFLVIGLSHIIQHRVWAEFFLHWQKKGEVGAFYTAFLHFAFGVLIVGFHNIWSGIPIVLTLMGWGWVLKGLIYFVYPKQGVRMLNRLRLERSWEFIIPGIMLVVYAGLLTYHIFRQ